MEQLKEKVIAKMEEHQQAATDHRRVDEKLNVFIDQFSRLQTTIKTWNTSKRMIRKNSYANEIGQQEYALQETVVKMEMYRKEQQQTLATCRRQLAR
uniref:Uncharacterized protein n=1 Tax=Globodera rostochiensis TaxID=31243 RepID=A0A914H914_GLORO